MAQHDTPADNGPTFSAVIPTYSTAGTIEREREV